MPGFVKTQRDEHLWKKAKFVAKEAGRKEDWPYITGIYKKMKGESLKSFKAFCESKELLTPIKPCTTDEVSIDKKNKVKVWGCPKKGSKFTLGTL